MKTIGEKLRVARESQGRTLDDIAGATRMNPKFLDDIEHGVVPKLPATYIRAFIRAFANEVGLDPSELLLELDQDSSISNASGSHPARETARNTSPRPATGRIRSSVPKTHKRHQGRVLIGISTLMLAGLFLSLVLLRREREVQPVQEISFSEVMKEQESKLHPQVHIGDSVPRQIVLLENHGKSDSLSLEGTASESVWVKIVIDGAVTTEHTLPPLFRMRWKAKKSFGVSLGNATGISFLLNGQKLGTLASVKKPLRNVTLSWETLAKLQQVARKPQDGNH